MAEHSDRTMLPLLFVALAACSWASRPAVVVAAASPLSPRLVNVSNGVEFWTVLADQSVDVIQMLGDVHLADGRGHSVGNWTPYEPLLVQRNVTVQAWCGRNCRTEDYPLLDFGFLASLVLLDTNIRLTMFGVTITKFGKGSGLQIDMLLGRKGSSALFENSIGYRIVCSPGLFQTQAVQKAPVSDQDPSSREVLVLPSFCWRGTCNPNALHYDDYATMIPATGTDSSLSLYGADSGWALHMLNGTRLCMSYWPMDCLQRSTPDQCSAQYINKALAAEVQTQSSGPNVAAIAVPVAISGAALIAAAAVLLLKRHRAWRQAAAVAAHGQLGKDPELGGLQHSCKAASQGPVLNIVHGPSVPGKHDSQWERIAQYTNPLMGTTEVADDQVYLGGMLGAGSSGRVYRARWRDQVVAVKVLQHDAHSSARVANEARLMITFDDPHVVHAYHMVSWAHQRQRSVASAAACSENARGSQQNMRTTADSMSPPSSSCKVLSSADNTTSNTLLVDGRAGQHCSGDSGGALQAGQHKQQEREQEPAMARVSSSSMRDRGACCDEGGPDVGENAMVQTWLVQEFCDGNTLAAAVRAGKLHGPDGTPHMAKLLSLLHDVACGMRYLHARNVLHRDLKASNVLLASDPTARYNECAKVADFGLSCALGANETHRSSTTMGTVSHMAPELLRAGRQSPATDVYAFSICMWEVAVGRAAFGSMHYGEVFERMAIAGERPAVDAALQQALGAGFMQLMHACWSPEPALRPNFSQICSALEQLLQQYDGQGAAGAGEHRPKSAAGASQPGVLGGGACTRDGARARSAEPLPLPVDGYF